MCREGDGMQPEQREVGPDATMMTAESRGWGRGAGDGLH